MTRNIRPREALEENSREGREIGKDLAGSDMVGCSRQKGTEDLFGDCMCPSGTTERMMVMKLLGHFCFIQNIFTLARKEI